MRQSAALVERTVAARRDAQLEKRRQHLERDEARAAAEHLAVVDELAGGQRVLEVPRHHDRAVVLDMLGEFGFAAAFDSFAQTRDTHPGREGGAEAGLVDELKGGLFAAPATGGNSPEMMVTMALEHLGETGSRHHPRPRAHAAASAACRTHSRNIA